MSNQNYLRSTDTILMDFAAWLNEQAQARGESSDKFIKVNETIENKAERAKLLAVLLDKLYDKELGFWYFTEFVLGPDPVTGRKFWNPLVNEFYDIIKTYSQISLMAPRGHGKSYFFSIVYPLYLMFIFQRVEILVVTNVAKQAKTNFTKLKNLILDNELLSSRKERDCIWNQDELEFNKSFIYTRSLGGVTRGIHVNLVIGDDILRDDDTYSTEYILSYFKQSVMPTAQTKRGRIILVGTPQSQKDIFHYFMQDDSGELITDGRLSKYGFYSKRFQSIIDGAIGKVLLDNVLNFSQLNQIREMIGDLSFEKEYQCNCVSDSTSIFPEALLMDNFLNEQVAIQYSGTAGESYIIAADVATSGAASADFSAFTVLHVNKTNGIKSIVHVIREKGMEVSKQIDCLADLSLLFNRAPVMVEKNNVGVALIQELIKKNVPIEEFITDRAKKEGIIRYLQNEIKRKRILCPDVVDKDSTIKALYDELRSFGVRIKRGKESMEAISGHDDMVMSLAIANYASQIVQRPFAAAVVQN